jgi:hypothetical protein
MILRPFRPLVLCVSALALVTPMTSGCGGSEPALPPVATPTISLSHDSAPAASPLEITYRFAVASDARFDQDYRVLVHVVDSDEELMWTDDHNPPVPTTRWKPGETIEYTRTIFVPVFPYVGEAAIQIGLHSTVDERRLPLNGEHIGQFAYRVGRLQLLPQTDNLLTVFKDGWHPSEVASDNATVEWQWTRKEATLAFKNPKKDALFYLELDSPGGEYHGPQQVQVLVGGRAVDEFTLAPGQHLLRKAKLPAAQLGAREMSELQIRVDKSWVPAHVAAANSKDTRELGVRVFHAFVDPR